MHGLAVFLPPVVAGPRPRGEQIVDGEFHSGTPPRCVDVIPAEVLAERPQPGSVPVQLEIPPLIGAVPAGEREARRQHPLARRRSTGTGLVDDPADVVTSVDDHPRAPVEEGGRRAVIARGGDRISDERAVPEPAVALVSGECRARRIGALGGLETDDQSVTGLDEVRYGGIERRQVGGRRGGDGEHRCLS